MVLAVVASDLHVHHWVAEHATERHGLLDPLLHSGNELARDGASHDFVVEHKSLSPSQRGYPRVGHAELAVAASLLLVLTLCFGRLGDRFSERHLELFGGHLDAELPVKPLAGDG